MALNPARQQASEGAHAPHGEGWLLPLGMASLLLGLLFLFFWILLGLGLDGDAPDAEAATVIARRWVLLSIGCFLGLQGLVLVGVRLRRSEALGAGASRLALAANAVVMVALATVLLGLGNYVFSRHELWRADLTSQKLYTLSEESRRLVAALEGQVKLVALLPPGNREADAVERLLRQYRDASPRVLLESYNPRTLDSRELKLRLEALELDPDASEGELLGVVVQSGRADPSGEWRRERSKHIALHDFWERDATDPGRRVFLGERLLSSAIREVTEGEPTRAYFLTGHGEKDIEDFEPRTGLSRLVQALRQRNVDVEELDLLTREGVTVPEDCDLLVVAGPKKALTEPEVAAVTRYLDGGGRALFLLEAWYRSAEDGGGTRFDASGLEEVLAQRYGIEPLDEAVLLLFADPRTQRQAATPQLWCESLDKTHPITQPLALRGARIAFYSARPIQHRPTLQVDARSLVTTASWGQRCFSTPDPARRMQTAELIRYGPFSIGVAAEYAPKPDAGEATPRKRSRVAVFGDVEWVTNQFLQEGAYSNQELFLNTFHWLLEEERLMVGESHRPTSYRLSMTSGALERIQALACPGLPAVALALGLFAWILRRRS